MMIFSVSLKLAIASRNHLVVAGASMKGCKSLNMKIPGSFCLTTHSTAASGETVLCWVTWRG